MRTVLALTAAAMLLASTSARAHVAEGSIPLTVAEEVPTPGVTPPVNAGGTAELELTNDLTIEYTVTVHDLTGDAVFAHIHLGAAGVAGDIVVALTPVNGTTFQGETPALTNAQVETFLGGGHYVNVHTDANPFGEIRGQIVGLERTQSTCSCTLSKKAFRKCVNDEIKKLEKPDRKTDAVKQLKRLVKKSSCGLTKAPKKKPLACCLPITEAANGAVAGGRLCAPVKNDTQCTALAGQIVEGSCVPDNPCNPPASPSGAFID